VSYERQSRLASTKTFQVSRKLASEDQAARTLDLCGSEDLGK